MSDSDFEKVFGASIVLPFLTVERFADLVGLPVGVCEAHADRRLIPIFRLGKRRLVNIELLRKQMLDQEFTA
jgi:hypothetical protein